MESFETLSQFSNWTSPDLEKEKGEIKRAARDFMNDEDLSENLAEALRNGEMTDLSESDWEELENSDSFHNVRFGCIDDARAITEEYNGLLDPSSKRDFEALLDGFISGRGMECPMIIKRGSRMHLISGNTRLMISRALGIKPKVLIASL